VRKADNLPPSCADVKKSGALNLLFRPVMGQLYLYLYPIVNVATHTGRCIPKVDDLSLIKPQINVELRLFMFETNDEKPLVCHRGIRHARMIQC
jgi:hypothetical protein